MLQSIKWRRFDQRFSMTLDQCDPQTAPPFKYLKLSVLPLSRSYHLLKKRQKKELTKKA